MPQHIDKVRHSRVPIKQRNNHETTTTKKNNRKSELRSAFIFDVSSAAYKTKINKPSPTRETISLRLSNGNEKKKQKLTQLPTNCF